MRLVVHVLAAFGLFLVAAGPSFAACGDDPGDAQAVAATRAQIAGQCDCAGANNHGAFVRCAAGVTNQAVEAGTLSEECAEVVMTCAGNSTCGQRGAVTCCRTDASGTTKCSVVTSPGACTAPRGGSACVGTQPSCCDACVSGGCAGGGGPPTLATTTTTVATTTTTRATTTTTVATTTTTTTIAGCCGFPTPGPTRLRFESVTGSGSVPGSQFHVGTGNITLTKGGLFFGGSGETVPLPSVVPDKGVSFLGTTCSGTTLTAAPMTAAQTGSIRTCTSPTGTCTAAAAGTCSPVTFTCTGTGVCTSGTCTRGLVGLTCAANADCDFGCGNDHDCDTCTAGNGGAHCNTTKGAANHCSCLFRPPLPMVNGSVPNASTCVINTVGNRFNTTVSGSGDCVQGSSSVSLPLNSEVYLTADLLPNRCNAGANVGLSCTTSTNCPGGVCGNNPAIQPCPICNPTTNLCNGGPNEGAPCTPGNSALTGHPEYPTSHDCPPPHVGAEIGGLPIPFALTTGTVTKTAFSTGAGNGKSLIFCALCKDPLGGFQNPPTPASGCTSDAQCTTAPFTSCEQNLNGAFAHPDADSITEVGEPAGDLTTGAMKPSTLASVFCIPPAYDSTTDTNGGLPGPGAVSIPGMAQLLP